MDGFLILMKVVDVYYLEIFKSFKVKKNFKFSVKVSLNYVLIDFWFLSEDIL